MPAHRVRTGAALAAAWLALGCGGAVGQVELARQITGLTGGPSTAVAQPPGEVRRVYQAVRNGSVRVMRDGAMVPAPVVAIPGVVASGESGLLGLAFHPQFQTNGLMYVLYTTNTTPAGTRIARYTLDPADPEVVIAGSEHTVLTIDRPPFTNHQGGWIGFGPDGYLYISSGNGGPPTNSQPLTTLLGKMLRIDVDGDEFPTDPQKNYAIPPTNPYAGSASQLPEIWASGLRNPWRCSFDRLTGDLWIGDVGDSLREEVNFQPSAGAPPHEARNYGYRCMEGTFCTGAAGCEPCIGGPFTLPFHEYTRSFGVSTLCGYVYRGDAIPSLRGTFVGADLIGRVYAFRKVGEALTEYRELTADLGSDLLFAMGEDQSGELYFCTSAGAIYKLVAQCAANCDGSATPPVLNVADFTCFLRAYAQGDPYANCDGSTVPPILSPDDFVCFLQRFDAGCP